MSLSVVPMTLREARAYVDRVHRHHRAPQGGLFAIGAVDGEDIVGVVIVGMPVARLLADGYTCEVTRLASDGSRNVCSMLYRAAWRAARAMGYRRLVTYTLPEEGGTSLRAAGFTLIGEAGGGTHCSDFPEPCSGHTGHGRYSPTVHVQSEAWVGGDAECKHRPHDGSDGRTHGGSVSSLLCCKCGATRNPSGRWPSNVLLSDPELFDEPNPWVVGSGASIGPSFRPGNRAPHPDTPSAMFPVPSRDDGLVHTEQGYGDAGGYSRFFIIPKADRAERERGLADRPKFASGLHDDDNYRQPGERKANHTAPMPRANVHPTVKPIDLMRHLVRLVTPPGGVVLDPFLGSGTTALAASEEGFGCIGIEREAEYLEIAKGRLMATPMGLGLDVPATTPKRGPIKDGAIGGNGLGSHYDRLGNTKRGVKFRQMEETRPMPQEEAQALFPADGSWTDEEPAA